MKKGLFIGLLFLSVNCFSQTVHAVKKPEFNESLAKKLGADDYGMKKYVMAFLLEGDTKLQDSVKRMELQMAHLKNIGRLVDEGKMIVAGPFLDDQAIRGIFIFNVATIEEAKSLTESDPAVKAGTLKMELHPWYSSAALIETPGIHKIIQKKNIME